MSSLPEENHSDHAVMYRLVCCIHSPFCFGQLGGVLAVSPTETIVLCDWHALISQEDICPWIIIKGIFIASICCTRWECRALYSNIINMHACEPACMPEHTHTHTHTHTKQDQRETAESAAINQPSVKNDSVFCIQSRWLKNKIIAAFSHTAKQRVVVLPKSDPGGDYYYVGCLDQTRVLLPE